jgi:hypothetical protein
MTGGLTAQPAPAAAPAAPPQGDPIELIDKLHKLHVAGALSEAEFNAKKAELLARLG